MCCSHVEKEKEADRRKKISQVRFTFFTGKNGRVLEGVWKQFQMTDLTMPNNFSFMKYAEKSVPGLADVGLPHGDGDGPRTPPRWLERVWKQFQMTNLTIPNNFFFVMHAEKSVPGLADVGVPHGVGDGPRAAP